jgi:hypothetical protein
VVERRGGVRCPKASEYEEQLKKRAKSLKSNERKESIRKQDEIFLNSV